MKIIYNQLKEDIRDILKLLCAYKGVKISESHFMPDHIHILVNISSKNECVEFYEVFKRKVSTDNF